MEREQKTQDPISEALRRRVKHTTKYLKIIAVKRDSEGTKLFAYVNYSYFTILGTPSAFYSVFRHFPRMRFFRAPLDGYYWLEGRTYMLISKKK